MFFYLFILFIYVLPQVFCLNFDVKNVTKIHLEGNYRDTYFGYTVHLQRGQQPMVIVGAPKADSHTGGAVYSCLPGESCRKYDYLIASNNFTFTSNFLGSALDGSDISGEEMIVCAPRTTSQERRTSLYQYGLCFYHRSTTLFTKDQRVLVTPLRGKKPIYSSSSENYYDYGFAQTGFNIHYMKENKEVLLGAPGIKSWSGAVIKQSLSNLNQFDELPARIQLHNEESFSYLGYSVSSGKFQFPKNQNPQIAVGGPRANKLDGLVSIFQDNHQLRFLTNDDESGTYYGAVVLGLDVNNDGIDEMFVGAPYGSGASYDEGYVYFYGNNFEKKYKLVGSQKTAARFGSAIASLGDIDYDSYNDVAISAPYEDDGVGAVYIYMGSDNGVQQTFSQRLSPLSFPNVLTGVRGFGMGLSRGNDLDNNGHNDLAVGAYQSAEVFLFYGLRIIDFNVTLTTNITSIKGDTFMKVTPCIFFSQRSSKQILEKSKFLVKLSFDYRTDRKMFEEEWDVPYKAKTCKDINVKVKESSRDIMPYKLSLKGASLANLIAKGEGQIETYIPYVHGCGNDDICQTYITISLMQNNYKIIVAKDKEVGIAVTAKNSGETGYQCQLYIDPPDNIELSQNSLCTSENGTYICPFASTLKTEGQASYQFDISTVGPITENLSFDFELKCLGVNLANATARASYTVSLENSPYIEGKSDPDKVYFQRSQPEDLEITHLFSVGNSGPSPVKQDIIIVVPIVKFENRDVFEFNKVTLNGFQSNCTQKNKTEEYLRFFDLESINGTDSYEGSTKDVKHIEIFCSDGYLHKSSQIARYQIIFNLKTHQIAAMYKKGILKENMIAYVTTAFLPNTTDKIGGYAATFIQSSEEKSTLLWVYILVGVILGIILLTLMVYLLYKCHFFDRKLRDKMNDEHLVNEQNENNEGEVEVDLTSEEHDLSPESEVVEKREC